MVLSRDIHKKRVGNCYMNWDLVLLLQRKAHMLMATSEKRKRFYLRRQSPQTDTWNGNGNQDGTIIREHIYAYFRTRLPTTATY